MGNKTMTENEKALWEAFKKVKEEGIKPTPHGVAKMAKKPAGTITNKRYPELYDAIENAKENYLKKSNKYSRKIKDLKDKVEELEFENLEDKKRAAFRELLLLQNQNHEIVRLREQVKELKEEKAKLEKRIKNLEDDAALSGLRISSVNDIDFTKI
jgi:predicted RNase H-like nuclease (RuvC/YqgF family)